MKRFPKPKIIHEYAMLYDGLLFYAYCSDALRYAYDAWIRQGVCMLFVGDYFPAATAASGRCILLVHGA